MNSQISLDTILAALVRVAARYPTENRTFLIGHAICRCQQTLLEFLDKYAYSNKNVATVVETLK